VSSPNFVAPWKNSTLVMLPPGLEALALIVTDAGAVNVALFDGEVMLTVIEPLPEEMLTTEEVVTAPWLSVAFAVRL
jgi:hypothetical protein